MLMLFCGWTIQAQDSLKTQNNSSERYVIETLDGKVFEGPVIERTAEFIILDTRKIGYIRIFFVDIASMQRASQRETKIIETTQTYSYQTPTHYLGAPTAFGIKKEQGYYQNTWILINQVGYGFSDNFSLGLGMIPIFISGESDVPIWIMPKFSWPLVKDEIEISLGSFNFWALGNINFGIVNGKIAFGGPRSHISVGGGLAYEDGKILNGMLFTFDGLLKVGSRATLTAENYVIGDLGVYTLGFHQPLGEAIIDLGLIIINDEFDVYPAPFFGVTVPFGKWE